MKSEILVPKITANDAEVEVLRWHVHDRSHVKKGQDLVELGLSKANVILPAAKDGYIRLVVQPLHRAPVGALLAEVFDALEEFPPSDFSPLERREASDDLTSPGPSRFSKAARQLLRESGLTESEFEGTLLVSGKTVRERLNTVGTQPAPTLGSQDQDRIARLLQPHDAALGAAIATPPSTLRCEKVGRRKEAQILALQVGQSGLVNSALTLQLQAAPLLERLKSEGKTPSFLTAWILHAIAQEAAGEARLTSFYHAGKLNFYDRIDLGYALNFQGPLQVAVIRSAERLAPESLHATLFRLSAKYAADKLGPGDVEGSTLTVSSLMSEGILNFQPLINQFQSAIFGIGGDVSLPGHPVTVTVNYDHRVFEGVDIARVLGRIRARLLAY